MAAVAPIDTGRRVVARRRGFAAVGRLRVPDRVALGALGLVSVVALFGPLFDPYNPRLAAGEAYLSPTPSFPFGTDSAGRDMLSRCLSGLQATWLSALSVPKGKLPVGER